MADLGAVRALYEAYIDAVETLVRNRKFGEGIFGLKGGPADNPCHDRFSEDLRSLLEEYAGEGHPSEETAALLSYIYAVPHEHREPRAAYWMMLAVQGHALPLIETLAPADAEALRERFAEEYPRRERLPVQTQTLNALKKRAR